MILVAKELDAELPIDGRAKAEIKAIVWQALTEHSMLKGAVKPAEMTEMQFQLELKKIEMQEREAERQREHELQKEREERERQEREAERQREHELQLAREQSEMKMKEMEKKAQLSEQEGKISNKDQIARSMSLVPRFDEREVEKNLLMFKKVAESMEWPRDMFCLFLQSVITGYLLCSIHSSMCYLWVSQGKNPSSI